LGSVVRFPEDILPRSPSSERDTERDTCLTSILNLVFLSECMNIGKNVSSKNSKVCLRRPPRTGASRASLARALRRVDAAASAGAKIPSFEEGLTWQDHRRLRPL
jgi:hypothetical protein